MPLPKATPKPEETWRPARLIPTTGIGGQDEQEQRATSSLLAVMGAVPQFGRAIVEHLDAPGGRLRRPFRRIGAAGRMFDSRLVPRRLGLKAVRIGPHPDVEGR
jgi:hypothetical protein